MHLFITNMLVYSLGRVFDRFKNEFFYHRDWDGVTMEFITSLDAYLRYYNSARKKESLGWRSPEQYRRYLGLAV